MNGYTGRVLRVDLTTRSISIERLSDNLISAFTGGAGINLRLAYENIKPHTDPLSSGNVMILGVGPLAGTLVPGSGRANFTAKSPSSGFIGMSGSGHMAWLKYAGYDHVIITGKARSPAYLEIGDEVRIRDAGHIWGKDTWEATETIRSELSRRHAIACIGPAGENLVRDASVIANKYSAFAKMGMGAVMGSKNLKAIAIYGSHGITVADRKRFVDLVQQFGREIMSRPLLEGFRRHGTLMTLDDMIRITEGKALGPIPYKNFQQVADENLMSDFTMSRFEEIVDDHGHMSCLGCPVGCKHSLLLKDGRSVGISCAAAPTIGFAGICAVGSWTEVVKCAELCNRLGMDYHSMANLIAMAIELYQKGIINSKDTGGMELDWNADVVYRLLEQVAFRRGFGDVLADGLIAAPKHIKRGSEYYAMHHKGVGINVGEPRPMFGNWIASEITNGIGRNVGVRELYTRPKDSIERILTKMGMPEDDMKAVFLESGKCNLARVSRLTEDYGYVLECLGVCTFTEFYQGFDIGQWAALYTAATGIDVTGRGLLEAAARSRDMMRAFNIREGASREDDIMPERFLTESLKVKGEFVPPFSRTAMDEIVTGYYKERGWDPEKGTVSQQRLAELLR